MDKESELPDTPQVEDEHFRAIDRSVLFSGGQSSHPPRLLLLYGSLRERSYSHLMTLEAARVLQRLGAETAMFNPRDLPLPDSEDASHPKVAELRDLVAWSEGMLWCSPERQGAMAAVMKNQIDWIPLSLGGVR